MALILPNAYDNRVMPTAIANVLAQRYASEAIQDLWSERGRIVLERTLCLALILLHISILVR